MNTLDAATADSTPYRVLGDDDVADPARMPAISDDDLRALYRTMVLTRAFDERMFMLQRQGRLGFYLPSTGEEAATVGSAFCLEDADWVFPCYREQGAYLWRGITVQELAHQCYGNAMDATKGRQMPVHYSFRRKNIVSISSPLAVQLPQATGAAWAAKLKGDPIVVLTYFGEGASSQGDFHVGLNFAAVYRTPTVFFMRNNGWAISTPREVQTITPNFAMKAAAYGMEGLLVDGNDVLAVIAATRRAVERARSGGGPTLIEAVTYRIGSHSTSDDPSAYRSEEEVLAWKRKDPIQRFQRFLAGRHLWTPAWEDELVARCRAEVLAAVEAAERAPAPEPVTLFEDCFAELPAFLVEQRGEMLASLEREGR